MAVAGVEIGVKRVEVERNLAGGVCAVDHRIDAGGAGARQQGLNGQAQRRGRGDVAEKEDARPFVYASPERFDERCSIAARLVGHGEGAAHVARACACADSLPGVAASAVLMICRKHLVTRLQVGLERACGDIDAHSGVGDKGDVIGLGIEQPSQGGAGLGHQRWQVGLEEGDGLALHARAKSVGGALHGARCGAKGAVVEEMDGWIKCELAAQGGRVDDEFSGTRRGG